MSNLGVKDRIVAQWEKHRGTNRDVARALGADPDYVAFILRVHRGEEEHRASKPDHDAHLRAIALANKGRTFPFYPADAWSRP